MTNPEYIFRFRKILKKHPAPLDNRAKWIYICAVENIKTRFFSPVAQGGHMYQTTHGPVTDAEAIVIDDLNHQIWKDFWSIPREKRTIADWEKLLDIQILVKRG